MRDLEIPNFELNTASTNDTKGFLFNFHHKNTYLRISVKADNRRVQARIAFNAIRFLCVFVNNEIKTNKSAQSFG